MVLTINPRKRSVTVYRSLTDILVLAEKDILDGGDVLPGFWLTVREVFAQSCGVAALLGHPPG